MQPVKIPPIRPDLVAVQGGMDVVSSPLFVKPGTPRLAYNYEAAINGGQQRAAGYEPYDGRASPSDAQYLLIECGAGITGAAAGQILEGATSGATGTIISVSATQVAVTQVAGDFALEVLQVSGTPVGTATSLTPTVDGFADNAYLKAAADAYQSLIGKVPGSGPIRGLAIHADTVYAWRDNAGGTAMAIYKATTGGWTLVPLCREVSFTLGTAQYDDGDTLNQGGVSATIKRVVLESGAWGSTAAGRFIIDTPTGGEFSNGPAAGGGACTISGASTAIALQPGGNVRTDRFNFGGSLDSMRLYGCDGVNREFEFGDDVLVPLETGMGAIRASCVVAHKYHLFYSYRGSVQFSSIGSPYQWSAVLGAGELATGDTITNLVSIGGSEVNAALMVTCQDSLHVLYGDSSDFKLTTQSRISGAQAMSAQDISGVVAQDKVGVVRYPATQAFGNFLWDRTTINVEPLAANKVCACSVFVANQARYRIFYTDGTCLSGFPRAKILPTGGTQLGFDWTVLALGRNIVRAVHGEIDGVPRTFYADNQGWVFEADKGRSYAGEPIEYALVLHSLNQKSGLTEKTYKGLQLEVGANSACTLYTSGEFTEDPAEATQQQTMPNYGAGLRWDLSNWGQTYWGVPSTSRNMNPLEGYGTAVEIAVAGRSDNELSHSITAVTVLYIPRRLTR